MDKYLLRVVLGIILILQTSLITVSVSGEFRNGKENGGQNEVYEDLTGNDVFKQRHLLAEEDNVTTTESPPQFKDIFTKIKEFYADSNNLAMFCVLPVMVVVYGGCCAIYCVAKLRKYIKKKQARAMAREDRERLNTEEEEDSVPPNSPPRHDMPPPLPPLPPITPKSMSPPPWSVQKQNGVEPMVPPLASHYTGKSHETTGRRDYKDLLRIKTVNVNEAYEDNEKPKIREAYRMKSPADTDGRESVISYKDELLARYDALSSFTMARKAATILRTGEAEEKKKKKKPVKDADLFNGKPKQKMIFIAE